MIFEKSNKSKVKDLKRVASEVYKMREVVSKLSNEELKAEALKLKKQIAKLEYEEEVEEILPFAYALAIEAIKRSSSFGFELTENQVIGAIAINDEKISEMATGEGKTVTAILPAFFNALSGNSTYIVTPNEYLAKRDAKKTEEVFSMLGMTVGVNLGNVGINEKISAYKTDIMYSTCTELGFDYLRDNCALSNSERVQPKDVFDSFLIIDEADSIMLDEANVPLVLSSSPTGGNTMPNISIKTMEKMKIVQKFVSLLNEDDYEISGNKTSIFLSQSGIAKAESFFGFKNITDDGASFNHYINCALAVNYLFERDKDYIVLDSNGNVTEGNDPNGTIILIDKNTQRRAIGKEYTEGYQQALLVKEGIENVNKKAVTLGKICIQHYIRSFSKFAGMTGTAMTDSEEFNKIYGTDVVSIPKTNPKRIDDRVDLVFRTKDEKIATIIQRVLECKKKGQPVLIGTITISQSEMLAKAFDDAGIKYNLLNATVTNDKETEIIAQAGRKGAVTIATDMAGRGTDINLGGNPEFMTKQKMRESGFSEEEIKFASSEKTSSDERLNYAIKFYRDNFNYFAEVVKKEKLEVTQVGGLHIIGTEKHISRRNDNQLRGRAGRQGDVGSTEFIISMEDEFIKLIDKEKDNILSKWAEKFKISQNGFVKNEEFSKIIANCQISMENRNSDRRLSSLKFENILTDQRRKIYELRNKVRNGKVTGNYEKFNQVLNNVIEEIVDSALGDYRYFDDKAYKMINDRLETIILPKNTNMINSKFVGNINNTSQLSKKISKQFIEIFNHNLRQICKLYISKNKLGVKEEELMPYVANDVLEICAKNMLKQSNMAWSEQIENLEHLKNTSSLRAFAGENVMQIYQRDAYDMFNEQCSSMFEAGVKYFVNGNDTLTALEKIHGYDRLLCAYALKIKKLKQQDSDKPKSFKIVMPE